MEPFETEGTSDSKTLGQKKKLLKNYSVNKIPALVSVLTVGSVALSPLTKNDTKVRSSQKFGFLWVQVYSFFNRMTGHMIHQKHDRKHHDWNHYSLMSNTSIEKLLLTWNIIKTHYLYTKQCHNPNWYTCQINRLQRRSKYGLWHEVGDVRQCLRDF